MTAPILVFGVGNESRGDDALGVLALRSLQQVFADNVDIEFIETYQLQIEQALDMVDREQVLFIDAGTNMSAPWQFYPGRVRDERTPFSHALSPDALLVTYRQIQGDPPPAQVMRICGEDFELGHALSHAASENLQVALTELHAWLTAVLADKPRRIYT